LTTDCFDLFVLAILLQLADVLEYWGAF